MAAFAGLELEELRAEIQQEEDLSILVENSIHELEEVTGDLKKRFSNIESEQNEWKTRFEIQQQVNQQLQQQIEQLKSKLRDYKTVANAEPSQASDANVERLFEVSEVTPYMLKLLERQKNAMLSEWNSLNTRIDEESKAYYIALEKRKHTKTQLKNYVAALSNRTKSQSDDQDNLTSYSNSASSTRPKRVAESVQSTKADNSRVTTFLTEKSD